MDYVRYIDIDFRYGLGMIYYKKEKFTLAETHFKKALAINPQSAVLLCHIGLVSYCFVELSTYTIIIVYISHKVVCKY